MSKGKSRRPFAENWEKNYGQPLVMVGTHAKFVPKSVHDVCCAIRIENRGQALDHWKKYHRQEVRERQKLIP